MGSRDELKMKRRSVLPAARPLTSCARLPRTQVRELPQRNDKKKTRKKILKQMEGEEKRESKVWAWPQDGGAEGKSGRKRDDWGSIKKEANGNRLWSDTSVLSPSSALDGHYDFRGVSLNFLLTSLHKGTGFDDLRTPWGPLYMNPMKMVSESALSPSSSVADVWGSTSRR